MIACNSQFKTKKQRNKQANKTKCSIKIQLLHEIVMLENRSWPAKYLDYLLNLLRRVDSESRFGQLFPKQRLIVEETMMVPFYTD